jgi:hypothetical protein
MPRVCKAATTGATARALASHSAVSPGCAAASSSASTSASSGGAAVSSGSATTSNRGASRSTVLDELVGAPGRDYPHGHDRTRTADPQRLPWLVE